MKDKLDFVVIGAQKSGTTTLFKLINQHKSIYIPPEKEAPYFNYKDRESLGWSWYINEFFGEAESNRLWATVTPQYMCYEGIAKKLHSMNPHLKVIAILRNPIERAFSHYTMSKKRGLETRSFSEAVYDLTAPEHLEAARSNPSETNSYIVWGEYGRILQEYKKYFPENQILLLTNDELESSPGEVVKRVFSFLNIEQIVPEGLGNKYHAGGSELKFGFTQSIRNSNILKKAWYAIVPFKTRRRFIYWFDQWNTKKNSLKPKEELQDKDVITTLKNHYYNDNQLLKETFGVTLRLDVNKLG